jgi:uncharacterized small protein (DUF1192 family)
MTTLQSVRSRISRLKALIERGGNVAAIARYKAELSAKCEERDALQEKITK